ARLRGLQQRRRPGRQDRPGRRQSRQSPRQPDQHAGAHAREVAGHQPGSGGAVMRALSDALRGRARSRAAALRPLAVAAPAAAAPAAGNPAPAYPAAASSAAAQSQAGGGCFIRPVPGGYELVCGNTGGTPGGPGTTGGSTTSKCSLVPLSKAQVTFLGLPWPAPKGHLWEVVTCPGPQPFQVVTLVSIATGAPAVTPQPLAQIAIAELIIPVV